MKTLEISLETLNRLIDIKNEIMDKYPEREGFNKIDTDEMMRFFQEPLRDDFRKVIADLSQNQKRELSAIVWLGRGDFDDFQSAYDYAKGFDGQDTASYLEGKPLQEYISKGIAALREEGIELKT